MKKTFALVLAVAMVMSLSAISLAASSTNNNAGFEIDSAAMKYGSDKNEMYVTQIQYGKAAYFGIYMDDPSDDETEDKGPQLLSDYNDVEKIKVKAKWEMGSDLVDSVSIVKKLIDPARSADLAYTPSAEGYYYFVEVKTVFKSTTSDADIIGTLTFNKKKSDESAWILDDLDEDISINVGYENSYLDSTKDLTIASDKDNLKWDTYYLLKFDYDDEVELSFGYGNGGDNEGTFTVDVSGQGKLLLYYLTTAPEEDALIAANPGAEMNFLCFNNVKFNRTGEFCYEMEDGAYAYQIVDGQLVEIPGCEYDDSDESFYFNTRVLGSYVFSDVELVNPAPAVSEEPVVTAPTPVENPETGAAA